MNMQDQLLEMLMQKDEITWQNIIYDLVKTEQMDPWDIDITLLSNKYLDTIRKLKETNFFISGKVLLAAAILLRIKSYKLVDENIAAFDNLLWPPEEMESAEEFTQEETIKEIPELLIKTPQPRKRKVSLQDLMNALKKALEVDERRKLKREAFEAVTMKVPEKKIDITELIRKVYNKIKDLFTKKERLTFTELVGSDKKEDKILTFVPLLHLITENKIDVEQKEHFGEIEIMLGR